MQRKKRQRLVMDMVIVDPKPSTMFPAWMTQRVKFLAYGTPVACAECGKKRKKHWTMTCAFRAGGTETIYAVTTGKKLHFPLTPVCDDHRLQPEFAEEQE